MDGQGLNADVVVQLDTAEMRRIGAPAWDAQGYYVTVGGAATWGDILEKVSQEGLLPYSVVTTSHASAGGTVAADCLSRSSPLTGREGRHVRSFKLLTMSGETLVCRRDDPDPARRALFQAVIGGFGYLGVITEVTIDLRPPLPGWVPGRTIRVATKVDKRMLGGVFGGSWGEFLPGLRERSCPIEVAECADGFFKRLWNPRPLQIEPTLVEWDAVSSAAWFALGQVEALRFCSRYVLDRRPDPMPLYEPASELLKLFSMGMTSPTLTEIGEGAMFALYPGKLYIDELRDFMFFMENQITPMKEQADREGWRLNTVQQTFVLPAAPAQGDPAGVGPTAEFLEQIRPIVSVNSALPAWLDPLRPALLDVLYLPADEFLLSANRGLDGYAVTITFTGKDGDTWVPLREGLSRLSEVCAGLGGRVHMVKNVEAEASVLKRMYGDAFAQFLDLKRQLDPRGMIQNEFFDRVIASAT
jgi:FAD/FMN-containing dehydrogenase